MIRVLILILAVGLSAWRAGAAEPLLKVILLENGVACVRAASVTDNFAGQLREQLTNKISWLVLDLRFADGDKDVTIENLLPAQQTPILLLVNAQTRGAAAELAAQLRANGRAILIGGTNVPGKIAPDIATTATSDEEKQFQENPFFQLPAGKNPATDGANDLLPFIDHTSEADLVRRRIKDGETDQLEIKRMEPPPPVIRDPALARAVDLVKALAILRPARG
jgi:hypothetical protein